MHVIIVGAGLGGLSLAQCLRKNKISFEVFERDSSPDSRFQGWAITLRSAVIDEIATSFPSDMPDLKAATNHLTPLKLPAQMCMYLPGIEGRIGYEDSPETPNHRAERLRLRQWLLTNLNVQWGKQVLRIDRQDGGITVHFADGGSAKGDILVGADGINSVVRGHLLQQPNSSLLNVLPIATIIGEATLSGDDFKRQLELGHSAYIVKGPDEKFFAFCGLHYALADGNSGRYYWHFTQPDANVGDPDHWLRKASQQEKLDHVRDLAQAKLPPKLFEIFELSKAEDVEAKPHIWRDIELAPNSVPAGPILLLGDAAHAMMPFRGEGGHHAFLDALRASELLLKLRDCEGGCHNTDYLKLAVEQYNHEMLTRGLDAVKRSKSIAKAENATGVRPLPEKKIDLVTALA